LFFTTGASTGLPRGQRVPQSLTLIVTIQNKKDNPNWRKRPLVTQNKPNWRKHPLMT